jgi:hypothetical protein
MDKKDIYDHLAKIYLDASSETSKKSRKGFPYQNLFLGLSVLVIAFSWVIFAYFKPAKLKESPSGEIALVLLPDATKINFNFNPAKKEVYSIELNRLNLSHFRALAFSLKKANYYNNISVRVEFNSAFREKSEVYVKNIPYRWQDYRIELSEFKNISSWSNMRSLAFIVEEWNTKEHHGVVYIDNIRLVR